MGHGECSPDFGAKGQDYIFALPLFDSFATNGQLKFVVNQRITRTKYSALMFTRLVSTGGQNGGEGKLE